jgi:glutaredoxin-like protein
MIPLKDQELIREKFRQELAGPVKVDFFTERDLGIVVPGKTPCQYCKAAGQMLRELSGLSDLISLRVHYLEDRPEEASRFGVDRPPAIVLRGLNGYYLKFYGLPGGTEFPAFLDTVVDVSRGETLFSGESIEKLGKIQSEILVKVFVTPACGYCPAMMRAAYQATIANPRIKSEVIEVNEFPDLAERYRVQAVPLTVIDDRVAIPGMVAEQVLVEELVKAAESKPRGEAGGPGEALDSEGQTPVERGKERASGLYIP